MAEIEVKAKVADFTQIIKKIQQLGCTLSDPIQQIDKNYLRNGDKYEDVDKHNTPVLRIRWEKNQTFFTIKYKRTTELDNIEKEVIVSDGNELESMLQIMDYYAAMQINKVRRKTRYGEYEICLDQVEGLGSFIEVEKITEEDAKKVQKELMEFLISLGIDKKSRIKHGYDMLLLPTLQK